MAGILRGEIYWADLNPVRGRERAGLRMASLEEAELTQIVEGLLELVT